MPFAVYIDVTFRDAGPFDNQRRYRLRQTLADDGSDMDDVLAAAQAALTALETLTWDHIQETGVSVILPGTGPAANAAANNNVEAFSRTHIPGLSDKKSHFSVPAWDDTTYDKAANGLLSAAYDAAASIFNALICDVETGENMDYDWSQSRGLKRGQRQVRG